jgi:RNA polymerase sigma-70 factor (ECF subfamily)
MKKAINNPKHAGLSDKYESASVGSGNPASLLGALYTAFNEAYCAAQAGMDIDTALLRELIGRTRKLAAQPGTGKPEVYALLSYMLLESSRIPAMRGVSGKPVDLKNQDRRLWDKTAVEEGLDYLKRSAEGKSAGEYHLKAAVSACHSLAKDYRSTDWKHIISLYDQFMEFNDSSHLALERARIISRTRGARAGVKAIEDIKRRYALNDDLLLNEELGDLHLRLHEYENALSCYEISYTRAESKTDKSHYKKKIAYCKKRLKYKKKYALGLSF